MLDSMYLFFREAKCRVADLQKVGMPDTSSPMVMTVGKRSCSIWFISIMYTTASMSVDMPKYSS